MKDSNKYLIGSFFCFGGALALIASLACTPAQTKAIGQGATIATPIVDTACKILETQTDNAVLQLSCDVLDGAGHTLQTFKATIPRQPAANAMCPRTDGKVAP